MRGLMMIAAGVAALCGMTTLGQTSSPVTTVPGGGMPVEQEQHILAAHRDFWIIHRALIEGMHDLTTLQLLSQALTDRTTLLQSELNRVSQLQALVAAIQGGNAAAIRQARQAVRAATETVVANARIFSQACNAIRERLESLPHPERHHPPATGPAQGATND
jgi:hypothetical protein